MKTPHIKDRKVGDKFYTLIDLSDELHKDRYELKEGIIIKIDLKKKQTTIDHGDEIIVADEKNINTKDDPFELNIEGILRIEEPWKKRYDLDDKLLSMQLSKKSYKEQCWFVRDPHEVMLEQGFNITKINAQSIADYIEGEYIDTLYWFTAACYDKKQADEIIKWMVGPLKELMIEHDDVILKSFAIEFGQFVSKVVDKTITATMGKEVLRRMYEGEKLEEILEDDQFKVTSGDEVEKIIDDVIAANPDQVAEIQGGNEKILGWLVGQIMKASKGKANAGEAKETLKEKIGI